jgi:hypothetical protein
VTLFTIGYEATVPARLIETLRGAGVSTLVDVRALANSRRPGFAKTSLSAALTEAGIRYEHAKALGTPAEGRAAVRAGRPASAACASSPSICVPKIRRIRGSHHLCWGLRRRRHWPA